MQAIERGLSRLASCGYVPRCVLDVGAYEGAFSVAARSIWQSSTIYLVEPIVEKASRLKAVVSEIGNAKLFSALLGEEERQNCPFYYVLAGSGENPISTGSSRYREKSDAPMQLRYLEQTTIDRLLAAEEVKPDFIKLDVQGSELDVLAGAVVSLAKVEFALLELSLVSYNVNAPLLADCVHRLDELGFALFDILDLNFYNNALFQIDGLFIRKDSQWRLRFAHACNEPISKIVL